MNFRTEIPLPPSPFQLFLQDKLVTLGSCFAENMGNRLSQLKLGTYNNPFGTIFNPLSLFKLICAAICPDEAEEFQFVEREGRWFCYDVHSRISGESQEELQQLINLEVETLSQKLREAKVLLLTLGTGWVYELNETGQTIANCHKMPAELFTKRLLEAEEIVTGFAEIFSQLKNLNPELQVVLTVSPVRHLKDTLVLNQVSKSVLRLATHHLTELLPDVQYFPAYELQLDDLRDYRFYADDLLHPSTQAVQYIWEKFSRAYFSHELQAFAAEWEKVSLALQHRPFHPDSPSHQAFIQTTLNRLEGLTAMFRVDLQAETNQLKQQLVAEKPLAATGRKTKKARPELVALIQSVANSEIMREEEPANTVSLPVSDVISEPEITTVLEEQPVEAIDIDALQQLAEELELELQLEEEQPETESSAVTPEGISKAKKRRNKRKAKKIAAREAAIAASVEPEIVIDADSNQVEAVHPDTPPTAETPVPAPVVRKPRGKAATRKAASAMNSLLGNLAEVKTTPSRAPEKLTNEPAVEPIAVSMVPVPKKPIRKSRAKTRPEQPRLDFDPTVPEPVIVLSHPDKSAETAEPAPAPKEAKPAKEAKKPTARRTATKKKIVLKKTPAKSATSADKA